MTTKLNDGDTILFIGDSITDCGRRDPQQAPHGSGYVSFFRDLLLVHEPEKSIKVINTGVGGNTVEDLRSRWVDDMLAHDPDWLAIKIGINDCHRWTTNAEANPLQSPEQFEEIYDQLLTVTRDQLPDVKIVLIDPFYAGQDRDGKVADSFRGRVSANFECYLATVERMAAKHNTLHVRTNDVFWRHFEHQAPSVFFPNEPVHPNQSGHMLIAHAVYDGLSEPE